MPCQGISHIILELFGNNEPVMGMVNLTMKGDKMTPYLVSMTDGLIGGNTYDQYFQRNPNREDFLRDVTSFLRLDEVEEMRPETLGRIMGSFGVGVLSTTKEELFSNMHFAGDAVEILRSAVAFCLAVVIYDRLNPAAENPNVPPYPLSRKKPAPRGLIPCTICGASDVSECDDDCDG